VSLRVVARAIAELSMLYRELTRAAPARERERSRGEEIA
jgi:hypothetical protein